MDEQLESPDQNGNDSATRHLLQGSTSPVIHAAHGRYAQWLPSHRLSRCLLPHDWLLRHPCRRSPWPPIMPKFSNFLTSYWSTSSNRCRWFRSTMPLFTEPPKSPGTMARPENRTHTMISKAVMTVREETRHARSCRWSATWSKSPLINMWSARPSRHWLRDMAALGQ